MLTGISILILRT